MKELTLRLGQTLTLDGLEHHGHTLFEQKQVINRYIVGRIMQTDGVVDALRRTIRKYYPDVRVENEELLQLMSNEILRREIVEGEAAAEAKKKLSKVERAAAPANPKPSLWHLSQKQRLNNGVQIGHHKKHPHKRLTNWANCNTMYYRKEAVQ